MARIGIWTARSTDFGRFWLLSCQIDDLVDFRQSLSLNFSGNQHTVDCLFGTLYSHFCKMSLVVVSEQCIILYFQLRTILWHLYQKWRLLPFPAAAEFGHATRARKMHTIHFWLRCEMQVMFINTVRYYILSSYIKTASSSRHAPFTYPKSFEILKFCLGEGFVSRTILETRRPVPSTDQALPSCFYFSWILMERPRKHFFGSCCFLQGLRS